MPTTPPLKNQILVTKDTLYHNRFLVTQTTISMALNDVWDFDAAATLGADAVKYDFTKMEILAYYEDTNGASATNGYHVRADSQVTVAFKDDGKVRIVSKNGSATTFIFRVYAPLKPV